MIRVDDSPAVEVVIVLIVLGVGQRIGLALGGGDSDVGIDRGGIGGAVGFQADEVRRVGGETGDGVGREVDVVGHKHRVFGAHFHIGEAVVYACDSVPSECGAARVDLRGSEASGLRTAGGGDGEVQHLGDFAVVGIGGGEGEVAADSILGAVPDIAARGAEAALDRLVGTRGECEADIVEVANPPGVAHIGPTESQAGGGAGHRGERQCDFKSCHRLFSARIARYGGEGTVVVSGDVAHGQRAVVGGLGFVPEAQRQLV